MIKLFTTILILIITFVFSWIIFFEEGKKPNVIILMLDTLRADHLSSYGYQRETSPNIDKFAKTGILYKNAITAAPWTPPAVASILTGLYPSSHKMMPPNARELAASQSKRLNEKLDTLPEILKKNDYQTIGISPNPWITKEFGYDQGFDVFETHLRKDAKHITDRAISLLEDAQKKEQPFFGYFHYLDPHDPYKPPAPFDTLYSGKIPFDFEYSQRMTDFINKYDGEISFLDQELGRLFNYLEEKNLVKNTIIIIVADHGEQFMEHGDHRHGYQLFNEELNVPLIVKVPSVVNSSAVINEPVSVVDIVPTILDVSKIKFNGHLSGVSLVNFKSIAQRQNLMAEIDRVYHQRGLNNFDGKRLIVGTSKNDTDFNGDYFSKKSRLYDSFNDVLAKVRINDDALRAELIELLKQSMKNAEKNAIDDDGKGIEVKPETLEQLKSLGYLE
jgi:arylsulfatase A-like enzyme